MHTLPRGSAAGCNQGVPIAEYVWPSDVCVCCPLSWYSRFAIQTGFPPSLFSGTLFKSFATRILRARGHRWHDQQIKFTVNIAVD